MSFLLLRFLLKNLCYFDRLTFIYYLSFLSYNLHILSLLSVLIVLTIICHGEVLFWSCLFCVLEVLKKELAIGIKILMGRV
jgi:hypothetical protein